MSSETEKSEVEKLLDQLLLDQLKALNESANKIQDALRQTNDAICNRDRRAIRSTCRGIDGNAGDTGADRADTSTLYTTDTHHG